MHPIIFSRVYFFVLALFGFYQIHCNTVEIRHPIFITQYQSQSLPCDGNFQDVISFDVDLDGNSDLVLVQKRKILCYLSKKDGFSEIPLVLETAEDIVGIDLTHSPEKSCWICVATQKNVLFFDEWSGGGKNLGEISFIFAKKFFYSVDRDSYSDLVIPFLSSQGWKAKIYLFRNPAFQCWGEIDLDSSLFPLEIHSLSLNQSVEIAVESQGILRIYSGFPLSLQKTIEFSKVLGQPKNSIFSLLGIGDLNSNQKWDIVIGKQNFPPKLWVWMDQEKIQKLDIAGAMNLGIAFQDANCDGKEDIVCILVQEPSLLSSFFQYIFSANMKMLFDVHIFWNEQGNFVTIPQIVRKELHFPWKSLDSKFCLSRIRDIDDDGLEDGLVLDFSGKAKFFYNIFQICPEKTHFDFFDFVLKSLQKHLVQFHFPAIKEDWELQIHPVLEKQNIKAVFFPQKGKEGRWVFHYPFSTNDMIFVVQPTNQP
jgi:hypothetical protein